MGNHVTLPAEVIGIRIERYALVISGNNVAVAEDDNSDELVTTVRCYGAPIYETLEGFVRFVGLDTIAVSYAEFGDISGDPDFRVIYIYDPRPRRELRRSDVPPAVWAKLTGGYGDSVDGYDIGGGFGYALNLDGDDMSEWGYAPTHDSASERLSLEQIEEIFGEDVAFIRASPPIRRVVGGTSI